MWTIWSIFIFTYHFMSAGSDVSGCKNETDCSSDHICHDNICKKCINCELLYRRGSNCEIDFNYCGQCLPGYTEISKTNFTKILKPCIREQLKSDMCANDDDCTAGNYCHEAFCIPCFDCILLNKLPPNKGCAKNSNECGFCIDGYHELSVTANSNLKPCESKLTDSNSIPQVMLEVSNVLPFCILFAFAIVVVKLIIRKSKEENDVKVLNDEQSVSPSAPPLFVLDMPERVQCEQESEICPRATYIREIKQQANTARVFKQPTALYYFAEESADDSSDHSNDSNEEDSSPPQRRNEPQDTCSLNILIHRYNEMHSSSQELSEAVGRQLSLDDIDSASTSEPPSEGATKSPPQKEDTSTSKS